MTYWTSLSCLRPLTNFFLFCLSIIHQFEGKIKYGTRCKTCHYRSENTSSFKELEIPLKVSLPAVRRALDKRGWV